VIHSTQSCLQRVTSRTHLKPSHKQRAGRRLPASLNRTKPEETIMGRGILLWMLGVPIPIIILLALIWH
jgi:hypothetical protein